MLSRGDQVAELRRRRSRQQPLPGGETPQLRQSRAAGGGMHLSAMYSLRCFSPLSYFETVWIHSNPLPTPKGDMQAAGGCTRRSERQESPSSGPLAFRNRYLATASLSSFPPLLNPQPIPFPLLHPFLRSACYATAAVHRWRLRSPALCRVGPPMVPSTVPSVGPSVGPRA